MSKRIGQIWFIVAALCLLGALGLTGYNLLENYREGESSRQVLEELQVRVPAWSGSREEPKVPDGTLPDYVLNPYMEMPAVEIDGVRYIGKITFPTLDRELPVAETWSYPLLKKSPCRYNGSAYRDDFVVCAHNSRAHFGTVPNLSYGDPVIFTDMDGNVFHYRVADMELLTPKEGAAMVGSEYPLTIFTCTVGGVKRVTVRCDRDDGR